MNEPRRPASAIVRRGEARRRELLREAARIFLRDGLDGASMDLIAAEAGTSKATLYRHFGDRHGLLVQVVQFLCADFLSDIDLSAGARTDLRGGLRRILMQLAHVLSKPDHPAFFRLIVAGTTRDPAIGMAWHEHGPKLWHRRLKEVFVAARMQGELPAACDFTDCPEILFDAVFSDMIIRTAILGMPEAAHSTEPPSGAAGQTMPEPGRYIDALITAVIAGLDRGA